MKMHNWVILVLLVFLAGGCTLTAPALTETPTLQPAPTATATPLPPPLQRTTPVPDLEQAVRAYLEAWQREDYSAMYAMLTKVSRDAISEADYSKRYRDFASQAALSGLDFEVLSSLVRNSESGQASYRVNLHSVLVGDISRDTLMDLTLEENEWRVQYADTLIIPELIGGNYLWMDRKIPARANIYDRYGEVLVAYAQAVSIGIIPGQIDPEGEGKLLAELQWLTGIHPATIQAMYADFPPGADWYLPLGEAPLEYVAKRYEVTDGYDDRGLLMFPFEGRFYFENGIAPQAVGYVSLIQAEELDTFLRQGYNPDEKVGRQGIEAWAEQYLGGGRGGTLYVVDSGNNIVTQLADVPAEASQAVYTTLDKELQMAAQTMLLKYAGAVVVMEVDTGRVLAMASSPWFDPNAFEPLNYNSGPLLNEIYGPYGGQPLLNRASQGQYPLGSVFKIITMAAALESGFFTPDSEYDCQYSFTEIQGLPPRYDWTWDHFQEDGETMPSGLLTLQEGLMRSCNPYFWHIGLDLYRRGLTEAVSGMARGFGLGSPTGITGVEESAGNIPDPQNEVDAINNAIGQGDTQVTPLQVAQFIAAIANGGTIYQPQIVEQILPPDQEPVFTFEPIVKGTLPVSPETLAAIQEAMEWVVESRRGTAYYVLGAYSQNSIAMSGKTGTAESGLENSHAWFAGFTREGRENKPDIAIVVLAEYAGEGSEIAAPIFRGIVQQYFEGQRTYRLPWESDIGVLEIPEEDVEATP